MIRRLIAALAALLLAGIGALLLLGYVAAADRRAMAGMETTDVLVATQRIAEGTSVDQLARLVETKTLPVTAVPEGSLTSLEPVAGQVSTTDLLPGEPLLGGRFADPASLRAPGTVEVPAGMQEVTVALEPHRVPGGKVSAGDTVGVFISLPKEDQRPAQTKLVLHKVLVSRVSDVGVAAAPEGADSSGSGAAATGPDTAITLTLALVTPDAEKLVFGAEHGTVWLSLEPEDASEAGSRVVTDQQVYR